ncbi:MAG: CoA-transferase [Desulfovermiculus sp.]
MEKKKAQRMDLFDAVAMIRDGDLLTFSGFTIWRRPMAAIYEMIRQGKKDLHLVEVQGGTHSDLLIGAGCVKIWESCWIGHELYGKLGGNLARKAEAGEVIVEDYTHMQLLCRMAAGAMGLPYYPTYAGLGTDHLNPEYDHLGKLGYRDGSWPKIPKKKYELVRDPFFDSELVHVPACNPDWCIVFTQEVGSEGTLRIQGQRFSDEEAIKAADKVLVLAEHVVSEDYIRRDPDRNLIPHYMVDAIVECPWGAHPTGCYGLYEPDGRFIQDIYKKTRTQEGLEAWLEEWVFGVSDFDGYLHKLGVPHLKVLKANPAEKHSTLIKRGKA